MTSDSDHPHDSHPSTPWTWRASLGLTVVLLCLFSWFARSWLTPRGQSAIGLIALLTLVAALSTNLRAVNWRTIAAGLILQLGLALFILYTPQGEALFKALGQAVGEFLNFANKGATFVFGFLADGKYLESQFGKDNAFVFAFAALPAIIFVSSFFAILYYFGIIQFIVKILARSMMKIMGTSGAETLSSAANVFMGQTEAPLIVRPYVKRMTESELLALMAGGMATVSGAMIVLYATYGADTTAVLATSVMAAPCALYLSKLLVPETETPATRGEVKMELEKEYRNPIDAAASGALGGLQLALNVAAVLIAFIALVAMVDYLLQQIDPELSLSAIFSVLFKPFALMMGVPEADIGHIAGTLGKKLTVNELVAFEELKRLKEKGLLDRSHLLATYALTGFANFSSVGIQIGGIGAMAPERRADLARLGLKALLVGFLATIVNASLVGLLL